MKQSATIHNLKTKHPHELRLEKALLVVAKLINQWADSEFENSTIKLYQRLENELAKFRNIQDVKQRALERLRRVQKGSD